MLVFEFVDGKIFALALKTEGNISVKKYSVFNTFSAIYLLPKWNSTWSYFITDHPMSYSLSAGQLQLISCYWF